MRSPIGLGALTGTAKEGCPPSARARVPRPSLSELPTAHEQMGTFLVLSPQLKPFNQITLGKT